MLCGALPAWYLYGAGRTMEATVGFDERATRFGLLISALFLGPPGAVVLVSGRVFLREEVPALRRAALAGGVGVLLGAAVSETMILADEAEFVGAVAAAPAEELWRPRAWPHDDCALVHVPGRGIHATD